MEKKKKVLFDPGYAPIVIDSIGQIGYVYYMFSAIPNLKLKRLNFPITFKKIEKLLKINISFYLGCLLWANIISNCKDCEIEGNKLLGEDAKEDEYTSEINFLIDFLEKDFSRDCKYFMNKEYVPDEKYIKILKTYRKFLVINRGFVECSNTNQIKLPDCCKSFDEGVIDLVKEKIDFAISNKDLTSLFDCYNYIL